MDFFNAAADGREVVLFLMPSSSKSPLGSVKMSAEQARGLAQSLNRAAERVEQTPLSGAEAVAETTGAQLTIPGVGR